MIAIALAIELLVYGRPLWLSKAPIVVMLLASLVRDRSDR
jgi:hypothetical protein